MGVTITVHSYLYEGDKMLYDPFNISYHFLTDFPAGDI
jgi:hypothetical protein